MILRSNGTDSSVIQYLLVDAQTLEVLKDSLAKQVATLRSFRHWYLSESSRAVHESPLDEVKKQMQEFENASGELQSSAETQLKDLAELSQSMIQLVILLLVRLRKDRPHSSDRNST